MSTDETGKSWFKPISRRQFLCHSIGWLAAGSAAMAWGYEEPKHVKLEYHQIKTDKLAGRVRIVQLSDLHLDSDRSRDYVPKMVSNCNPDMILMTGDYTNHTDDNPVSPERLEKYVNRMKSKLGTYAVFGNWDVGLEGKLFANTDVNMLNDSAVQLRVNNDPVIVVGAHYFNECNAPALASATDADGYRIMLTHTPDMVDELSAEGSTDLHLCGHTHGGQIRIPFLRLAQDGKGVFPYAGGVIPDAISKNGSRYQSGMYEVGDMKAYVNRGIGMCGFGIFPKIRILCRPEVALFDIGPEDSLPKTDDLPWYQS